jgi:hypothetical protein
MKKILLAVLSIAIYGCPNDDCPLSFCYGTGINACDETRSYPFWSEWNNTNLVSIVDDSLVIFKANKHRVDCHDSEEVVLNNRTGLFLANYRAKQKPLLVDSLDYYLEIVKSYYNDSSVLALDKRKENFAFWKIGRKSVEFKRYNALFEEYTLHDANPWINENVLFSRYGRDQMSVLNTKTGQEEAFEFSGEYEWLCKCRAVSYVKGKILCLKFNNEADYYELIVDGTVTDTSSLYDGEYWISSIIELNRSYVIGREHRVRFNLENEIGFKRIDLKKVYKIDEETFKFTNVFTPIWIEEIYGDYKFYRDTKSIDDFVQYTLQDFND